MANELANRALNLAGARRSELDTEERPQRLSNMIVTSTPNSSVQWARRLEHEPFAPASLRVVRPSRLLKRAWIDARLAAPHVAAFASARPATAPRCSEAIRPAWQHQPHSPSSALTPTPPPEASRRDLCACRYAAVTLPLRSPTFRRFPWNHHSSGFRSTWHITCRACPLVSGERSGGLMPG